MRKFYKLLLFMVLATVLLAGKLQAGETFFTTGVITDEFPLIKVFFVATDHRDSSFKDLKPEDFRVMDNGINVSELVTIECVMDTVVPEVSVVLVLDKSTSMTWPIEQGNPINRWYYVKEAAMLFLNTLRFVKDTKVALTAFSKFTYKYCNFTNIIPDLKEGMDTIQVYGDTMYNPPFLNDTVGAIALLKTRPPNIRRIVVFLTDGEPNMADPPKTDSIINLCQINNIQVYSVTLLSPLHKSLVDISSATGGKAFEVSTAADLANIYKLIAIDIQMKQICSLQWPSPYGCDDNDRVRNLEITFLRINKPTGEKRSMKYTAPPQSVATVDVSEKIVSFGDPAVGVPVERIISVTPRISPLYVNEQGIEISPTGFFSIDWNDPFNQPKPPFIIDTNVTRKFKVKFVQGDPKQYRQATLMFRGLPCPPVITLVGGYNKITVVSPNGGEIISTCDSVDITWAGIDPLTYVNLSYSTNNGVTWLPIKSNVRGSSYRWLPPVSGTKFKVRASVSPVSAYMNAKRAGGPEEDVANSLAIQPDNLYFYVTGHFEGTAKFDDETLVSDGAKDIFVARYDRECNLSWVVRAGGRGIDTAAGIATDKDNNAYFTGVTYQGARFGSSEPPMDKPNLPYFFVSKVSPSGIISKTETIGATDVYTNFHATGQKIRYKVDGATQEIICQGFFKGELKKDEFLIRSNNWARFTATYDMELTLKNLVLGAASSADFSTDSASDGDGNKYKCGGFAGQAKFDTFTLNSEGGKDVYITKFGGTPGSDDQSDSAFTVDSPKLIFKGNTVDMGDVIIGESRDTILDVWLQNNGTIPVEIEVAKITGAAATEFRLDTDPTGQIIQPGEKKNIQLHFEPFEIGLRQAQLVIKGTCVDSIYLNLLGNGICSADVVPLVNMGNVNAGDFSETTIDCIFKNTNNDVIQIEPKIEPLDMQGDYEITPTGRFPVAKGQCVQMKIKFTPTQPGLRKAFINFNMPSSCENPKTELNGYGVDANLEIPPVDFGRVLVKKQADSFIVIKNNGLLDLKVTNADITDKTDNIFTIETLNYPYTIPKNEERRIKVFFKPQKEVVYNNTCMLSFDNSNQYPVALSGEGFLPKLVAEWVCAEPTVPGNTSDAELRLSNPSKSSEVIVKLAQFENSTAEFKWEPPVNPADITIPREGRISIPAKFSPIASGLRQNRVVLTSNAFDGEYEGGDWKDSFVDVKCEGLSFTFQNPFNMGNVLLCDEYKAPLEIANEGWTTSITIFADKVNFTGKDPLAFEVIMPEDLIIGGGEKKSLEVVFKPTENRDYSAILNLVNSLGLDLKVNIKAKGEVINIYADNLVEEVEPGENRVLPFKANIAQLSKPIITNMKVIISYDKTTVKFDHNDIINRLTNWTWETPVKSNGNIIVTGSGTLPTAFNDVMFTMPYTIYLGETKVSPILARAELGTCAVKDSSIQEAKLVNVCFLDGRLIRLSNSDFSLLIQGNSVENSLNVEYGVGFKVDTHMEIYNSFGDKVKDIICTNNSGGIFNTVIPVSDLSSGLYFLTMTSGPYTKTSKFMIVR